MKHMDAPRYWQPGDPLLLLADCAREQAARLLDYDHHQVVARSRWCLLLTCHWLAEEETEPKIAWLCLNPSPSHLPSSEAVWYALRKHPFAPPEVQDVVDALTLYEPEAAGEGGETW
jgi:hypothetical protein